MVRKDGILTKLNGAFYVLSLILLPQNIKAVISTPFFWYSDPVSCPSTWKPFCRSSMFMDGYVNFDLEFMEGTTP